MDFLIHKAHALLNNVCLSIFKRSLDKTIFTQFVKHYFVGGIGLAVNYLLFNILMFFNLGIEWSNVATYTVVYFTVFGLQKFYTYKPKSHSWKQPILFFIVNFLYGFFDTLILIFLIEHQEWRTFIAKLISIMILAPLSFLLQKYIVFRD
jgi:putative flippase GtrA